MSVTRLPVGRRAPRTAFVLGGGGNLGAIQVGMLRALIDRRIYPDAIVGCSVGALNGAALAARPPREGMEALEAVWRDQRTWQVFGGKLAGPWSLFRKGRSMVGNDRLRGLVEAAVPVRRFEDLAIPLHVVATSLRAGVARWFDRGQLVEPILASAALPAVLPPVVIDGELLVDGGVVDNVPIERATSLGVERVIVLHVGNFDRPRPDPQRPLDVLLQAFSITRNERFSRESQLDHGCELIVLPGIDPGPLRRNDFTRTAELIARGRAATAAFLDSTRLAVGAS